MGRNSIHSGEKSVQTTHSCDQSFDVAAIDQDLSWLKQLGLRINRLFFSGDYFLNVAEAKGMTAEAISEEMLAYWKESNRERRE